MESYVVSKLGELLKQKLIRQVLENKIVARVVGPSLTEMRIHLEMKRYCYV